MHAGLRTMIKWRMYGYHFFASHQRGTTSCPSMHSKQR